MDIIIGSTPPVKKDPEKTKSSKPGPFGRERRKNKQDRRKTVRDGIIVSLSTTKERRRQPERRRG